MLDKNAQIEQLIYTAGGLTKLHGNNGSFGVWSKTKGLESLDIQSAINEITNVLKAGVESAYARQTARIKVLKEGATPSGLFRKTYKDSDYEEQTILKRDAITILQQSKTGPMRGDYEDYRTTPEKAPFRIGATKLPDGRLLVVRVGQINRVYSELDNRTGNYFAHSLVFPQGTNIEDINLDSIDWQYGLEDKYWKGEGVMAPEYLETTSINKMLANKQAKNNSNQSTQQSSQQGENVNLTAEELWELYKRSKTEKDYKIRLECSKKFTSSIRSGANLVEVRTLAYQELLDKRSQGENYDIILGVINSLDFENCKFDELFEDFKTINALAGKMRIVGGEEAAKLNNERNLKQKALMDKLSKCDMAVVLQFARSQEALLTKIAQWEQLYNEEKNLSITKNNLRVNDTFIKTCQRIMENQSQQGMGN